MDLPVKSRWEPRFQAVEAHSSYAVGRNQNSPPADRQWRTLCTFFNPCPRLHWRGGPASTSAELSEWLAGLCAVVEPPEDLTVVHARERGQLRAIQAVDVQANRMLSTPRTALKIMRHLMAWPVAEGRELSLLSTPSMFRGLISC